MFPNCQQKNANLLRYFEQVPIPGSDKDLAGETNRRTGWSVVELAKRNTAIMV